MRRKMYYTISINRENLFKWFIKCYWKHKNGMKLHQKTPKQIITSVPSLFNISFVCGNFLCSFHKVINSVDILIKYIHVSKVHSLRIMKATGRLATRHALLSIQLNFALFSIHFQEHISSMFYAASGIMTNNNTNT